MLRLEIVELYDLVVFCVNDQVVIFQLIEYGSPVDVIRHVYPKEIVQQGRFGMGGGEGALPGEGLRGDRAEGRRLHTLG